MSLNAHRNLMSSTASCRNFDCIGILLTIIGLAIVAQGCNSSGKDQHGLVVIGLAEHDFGECRQGELLTHTFTLANKTSKPIDIIELKTSCGCLVPGGDKGFSNTHVLPNAQVQLPVHFTTGSQQETASARVIAFYKEPGMSKRRHLDLRVRADLLPDYRIEPRNVDFGELDGLVEQKVTCKVQVTPAALQNLIVHGASCSSNAITTQLTPPVRVDGNWEIEITLDVSQFTSSRSFNSSIVLETNSERLPKTPIQIRAKHLAPVSVTPEMIVISSEEKGHIEKEICLKASCGARLLDAQCSVNGQIHSIFDSTPKLQDHVVTLVVPPCTKRAIDCEVEFEFEFFPKGRESVVRTFSVPVHRFVKEVKEINDEA